jgi:hypothetical protein
MTMIRLHARAAVIGAAIVVACVAAGASETQPRNGTWKINNWIPGDSVHLTLKQRTLTSRWEYSENQPLADLKGLTKAQLRSASADVKFTMARDAGSFVFEGSVNLGIGSGTFSFVPDATFASKLAALGYDAITPETQFAMALRGMTIAFAEGVRGAGLSGDITSNDLVRFVDHGVDLQMLREIAAAGYTGLSGDDVVSFRDHGVNGAYLRGLKSSGYPQFFAADIVRMHDHGVDPAYVTGLKDSGYTTLEADDIIRLRDHGVDNRFVSGVVRAGYGHISVEELIRLRDHGVDSEYMQRIQSAGFGTLTVEQIVKLRDHGVD